MSGQREVAHEVVVNTTPELAFEAVTRASELREWMCDEAWTEVRSGGRYEVRWSSGYRAEGKFTAVEVPRRVAFTWEGSSDPGPTAVEFTVEPADGGVRVTVVHSGFGEAAEWDEAVSASRDGWTQGLENLKSTMETGVDLRQARRPFLGILFDILDASRAAKEGLGVEQGIYLNETVEGSGARAAGLAKGDVIVAIGGRETSSYEDLTAALGAHHAGDVVDVELVRGQSRLVIQATLGQRPHQDVPDTAEELADRLAAQVQESDALLEAAVEGVSDEEAGRHPAEGEWSAKEVLAHLSIAERDQLGYLSIFCLDGWLDTGPSNPSVLQGRIAAVLSVCPTLGGLVDRFLADEAETIAFLRKLPEEAVTHKARFRRIAYTMVGFPEHTGDHVQQIKAAIVAARGA